MNVIWYPFGLLLAALRFTIVIGSMALIIGIGLILIRLKIADQKLAFKIRTLWCKLTIAILGIHLHKTGHLNRHPGTMYAGNHRSFIDPIIAFAFIDNGYAVSKAEVSSYPLIGAGAQLSGVIYVQRNNSISRNDAKFAITEILREKKSILIYPEGTTSTEKNILPFKQGAFLSAFSTHSPVLPIAIEMGNPKKDFWYKDGLISQFFITYSKWRTDIYIHFFNPIHGESGQQLCTHCQQMIHDKLVEFQKNWK
jgi:1-acyl-sn-glycerol-3-phosphate acyltransferase